MTAGEIMISPVVAATPRASVRDITNQLMANNLSGVPVAERHGGVLGVITEADIIEAIIDGKQLEAHTAQEFMTRNPVTVDIDTPLSEVMQLLIQHRILRVPVTRQNKLVGMISRSDVIRAVLEPEFVTFGTTRRETGS